MEICGTHFGWTYAFEVFQDKIYERQDYKQLLNRWVSVVDDRSAVSSFEDAGRLSFENDNPPGNLFKTGDLYSKQDRIVTDVHFHYCSETKSTSQLGLTELYKRGHVHLYFFTMEQIRLATNDSRSSKTNDLSDYEAEFDCEYAANFIEYLSDILSPRAFVKSKLRNNERVKFKDRETELCDLRIHLHGNVSAYLTRFVDAVTSATTQIVHSLTTKDRRKKNKTSEGGEGNRHRLVTAGQSTPWPSTSQSKILTYLNVVP